MAFDPACLDAGVDFGSLEGGEIKASLCEFSLKFPNIKIPPEFTLPEIPFPPPLPIPKLSFELSCDPNKPIDITAGLKFGGGRIPCVMPDPDLTEAA
jgi:hypothetical protein